MYRDHVYPFDKQKINKKLRALRDPLDFLLYSVIYEIVYCTLCVSLLGEGELEYEVILFALKFLPLCTTCLLYTSRCV